MKISAAMHGKAALEKRVLAGTTVQPKNIAYPTDSKLYAGVIGRLHKIIPREVIVPRRSYVRELKELRLRFSGNPGKRKDAGRALSRLKTVAGALLRDTERKLAPEALETYGEDPAFYRRVLGRKPGDKNKI